MTRRFYPVTFTWRDATGREAQTRLYWAGPLEDETGDFSIPGLLGDGTPHTNSPIELLIDPAANDGVTSYLQACSSAALVALDGPFPERLLADVYGYDLERYGAGGVAYCSVEDQLRVIWHTQTGLGGTPDTGELNTDAPPGRWDFVIPAPVPGNFEPGHPSAGSSFSAPVQALLSQILANVSGSGERWDAPVNANTGAWCTASGIYLTNWTALPRKISRYSRLIRDQYRAPSLALPAL